MGKEDQKNCSHIKQKTIDFNFNLNCNEFYKENWSRTS